MQVLPAENYQLKSGGNNEKKRRKGGRKSKSGEEDGGEMRGTEKENKATEWRDVRRLCTTLE